MPAAGDSLVEQILRFAVTSPDALALITPDGEVSYSQLASQVDVIAGRIQSELPRNSGERGELDLPSRIAVRYPPSDALVFGLLGALTSGACCVPIAMDAPNDRVLTLLNDAQPKLLLSSLDETRLLGDCATSIKQLDLLGGSAPESSSRQISERSFVRNTPVAGAAFALYTSGTTGQPKGVLMTHQGFSNMAEVHRQAFSLQAGKRVLIYGSPVHGNWVNSLLIALANGATAVIESADQLLPGPDLLRTLLTHQITHVHLPPSSLAALQPTSLPHLEVMTLGGESLSIDSVKPWLNEARVFNCYGATESNWMSFAEITADSQELTIGRPMNGMQGSVVDANLQPLPQGEAGELIMSGIGLAQGYLNDAKLTREKFIQRKALGDRTWYRSGDRARELSDGRFQVMGRTDSQLAIRGYRIEPGEVEAALIKYPDVSQAGAYGVTTHRGTTLLCATLAVPKDKSLTVEQLRAWLGDLLPNYMIPTRLSRVEHLPLLANGKLDRKALERLPAEALPTSSGAVIPTTDLECDIADVWKAYTGEPTPYLDSDFYTAGGDSLSAVRLLWDLGEKYDISLPASAFLKEPTLAALVQAVQRSAGVTNSEAGQNLTSARLTATQERLWMVSRYAPAPALYNVPYLIELEGPVVADYLTFAMRHIIARHQPLRSRVTAENDVLIQSVTSNANDGLSNNERLFFVNHIDLTDEDSTVAARGAKQIVEEEANRGFDLEGDLGPRAFLISLSSDQHQLLLVLHHVVSDGWSIGNLFRELSLCYNAYLRSGTLKFDKRVVADALPNLPISYFEHARRLTEGRARSAALAHWTAYLSGAPTRIRLPVDYQYPAEEDYAGSTRKLKLDAKLADEVKRCASFYGVTPSTVYLCAYYILLFQSGAGEDLTVGVPLIGHERADTKNLIGLFASVVPQRCQLNTHTLIADLLAGINQNLRLAVAHQDIPLGGRDDSTEIENSPTSSRLLQSVFSHQNVLQDSDLELQGIKTHMTPVFPNTSKFELLVNVERLTEGWTVIAEYRTTLFTDATIENLLANYRSILHSLTSGDPHRVEDVYASYLVPASRAYSLSQPEPLSEQTLDTLFAEQCQRSPDAPALVSGDERFSYQQLSNEADRFAQCLLLSNVQPGSVVGLYLPRSSEAMISILGVLKAGSAYLPLPPEYPSARLAHMVSEANATIVVTQTAGDIISGTPVRQISYADLMTTGDHATKTNLERAKPAEEGLAYVMYTSGTSGTPNPVAIPHRGVIRLARNPDYASLGPNTKTLQLAPLAFDASTFEIWGAWLNGGCCVLFPDTSADLGLLGKIVTSESINTLWLTSSLFNAVVDENLAALEGLEQLLIGGEALSVRHVSIAQAGLPDVQIINGYGPTECTTFACTYPIPEGWNPGVLSVPIGQPIQDTSIHILDKQRRPVAPGLIGELYLSGTGLALGYLNDPQLTDERFPTIMVGLEQVRAYKTGDLVMQDSKGLLRFMGRADQQIKIRGYRIEPQQIEQSLLSDSEITQAAIVVRTVSDSHSLVAIIEANTAATPQTLSSIKARINNQLADYERPSDYLLIDELPTTANGKVDKAELIEYADATLTAASNKSLGVPSHQLDETETWVINLWCELLEAPGITSNDSFFELGGNSLSAIRCRERVRQTFDIELPLTVLFEASTAVELAAVIRQRSFGSASSSNSCKNLFFIQSTSDDEQGVAKFSGYLDKELNFCALPARGAPEDQPSHNDFVSVAAEYISQMQQVQAVGPYRLGGLAVGGLIAHEMAVQLTQAGHTVDYLLIGDAWLANHEQFNWKSYFAYTKKLAEHAPALLGRWRKRLGNNQLLNISGAPIEQHRPGIYPGQITFIRSSDVTRKHLKDEAMLGSPNMGWEKYASGGISRVVHNGTHSSIFNGEGAEQFAEIINRSFPD